MTIGVITIGLRRLQAQRDIVKIGGVNVIVVGCNYCRFRNGDIAGLLRHDDALNILPVMIVSVKREVERLGGIIGIIQANDQAEVGVGIGGFFRYAVRLCICFCPAGEQEGRIQRQIQLDILADPLETAATVNRNILLSEIGGKRVAHTAIAAAVPAKAAACRNRRGVFQRPFFDEVVGRSGVLLL